MPSLTSVKRSKADIKEETDVAYKPDEYPWGLRISLEDDLVSKLKASEFKAGDEVLVYAKATVKSKNSHEDDDEGGKVETSLSLQITEMALEAPDTDDEKAAKMFPDN